jgi:hypothetical protein
MSGSLSKKKNKNFSKIFSRAEPVHDGAVVLKHQLITTGLLQFKLFINN